MSRGRLLFFLGGRKYGSAHCRFLSKFIGSIDVRKYLARLPSGHLHACADGIAGCTCCLDLLPDTCLLVYMGKLPSLSWMSLSLVALSYLLISRMSTLLADNEPRRAQPNSQPSRSRTSAGLFEAGKRPAHVVISKADPAFSSLLGMHDCPKTQCTFHQEYEAWDVFLTSNYTEQLPNRVAGLQQVIYVTHTPELVNATDAVTTGFTGIAGVGGSVQGIPSWKLSGHYLEASQFWNATVVPFERRSREIIVFARADDLPSAQQLAFKNAGLRLRFITHDTVTPGFLKHEGCLPAQAMSFFPSQRVGDAITACLAMKHRLVLALKSHQNGHSSAVWSALRAGAVPIVPHGTEGWELGHMTQEMAKEPVLVSLPPDVRHWTAQLQLIARIASHHAAFASYTSWRHRSRSDGVSPSWLVDRVQLSLGALPCAICDYVIAASVPGFCHGQVRQQLPETNVTFIVLGLDPSAAENRLRIMFFPEPYDGNRGGPGRSLVLASDALSNWTINAKLVGFHSHKPVSCVYTSLDEMRELVCELPRFVDEVVAASRQGASLPSPDLSLEVFSLGHSLKLNIPLCVPGPMHQRPFVNVTVCVGPLFGEHTTARRFSQWAEYHRIQGVHRIIAYDRDGLVGPALSAIYADRFVEIVPFHTRVPPKYNMTLPLGHYDQLLGINACLWRVRWHTKWIGFFDIDEYLDLNGTGARVIDANKKWLAGNVSLSTGGPALVDLRDDPTPVPGSRLSIEKYLADVVASHSDRAYFVGFDALSFLPEKGLHVPLQLPTSDATLLIADKPDTVQVKKMFCRPEHTWATTAHICWSYVLNSHIDNRVGSPDRQIYVAPDRGFFRHYHNMNGLRRTTNDLPHLADFDKRPLDTSINIAVEARLQIQSGK